VARKALMLSEASFLFHHSWQSPPIVVTSSPFPCLQFHPIPIPIPISAFTLMCLSRRTYIYEQSFRIKDPVVQRPAAPRVFGVDTQVLSTMPDDILGVKPQMRVRITHGTQPCQSQSHENKEAGPDKWPSLTPASKFSRHACFLLPHIHLPAF
jgi:hypothetical protein